MLHKNQLPSFLKHLLVFSGSSLKHGFIKSGCAYGFCLPESDRSVKILQIFSISGDVDKSKLSSSQAVNNDRVLMRTALSHWEEHQSNRLFCRIPVESVNTQICRWLLDHEAKFLISVPDTSAQNRFPPMDLTLGPTCFSFGSGVQAIKLKALRVIWTKTIRYWSQKEKVIIIIIIILHKGPRIL